MKKLAIFAFALLLVVAFTMPAAALESQFGGYWRTRFIAQQSFDGNDDADSQDLVRVDTRTRLYYTAVFHENLKFVNKFEIDAVWGDTVLGDIGADGVVFEVKNSYADFNLGPVNAKVGIQGMTLARGFIFSDDFSGMVIKFKGESFSIPVFWVKAYEGGRGKDANDLDVDYYGIAPSFTIADKFTINPYVMLAYSSDASAWPNTNPLAVNTDNLNLWYAGIDLDVDFDMFSLWATAIYQGGDMDLKAPLNGSDNWDFAAWLAAVGAKVSMGWGDVHGQFFYATGDDDATDTDLETFWVPKGRSYYWSEITGYGIFDQQVSNNAPADQIGNVWAANVGATFKPMDKLKISLDIWYAALAEDIVTVTGATEDSLGTEVDLKITYQLVQGLNLDLVGAYLFAGDATTMNVPNDANPYEVGARLSLKF